MKFFPTTKLTTAVHSNGIKYAVVTYSWLWWSTVLYEIPIMCQFWPDDVFPLPKGVRFPKQPQPTEFESRLVMELIESRGYKVLRKFWNWYGLTLAHRCTAGVEGIETVQGMFQGFLRARIIPIQIAEWGKEKEEMEDESNMYVNQLRMDKEAPDGYY